MEIINDLKISIDRKVMKIENIIKWYSDGKIQLEEKNKWHIWRQSRLIESLILKIPLPIFYVNSDKKGNWTIIDGSQRLMTIVNFIGNKFFLKNLLILNNINELTFKDIDLSYTNRIIETELCFVVINPGTSNIIKNNVIDCIKMY